MASPSNARAPEPNSELARVTVCPLGAVGAGSPSQTALAFPGQGGRGGGSATQRGPACKPGRWGGKWQVYEPCLSGLHSVPKPGGPTGRKEVPLWNRALSGQRAGGPRSGWACAGPPAPTQGSKCPLPTTGPLSLGLSPVVTSVPLHQPQSQGSLWALTPPSLHLHTSCDGVLTASQAARPDTQSWGCQEWELISKC